MDDLKTLRTRRAGASDSDQASGLVFEGIINYLIGELGETETGSLRADARVPPRIITLLKYPVGPLLDLVALGSERLGSKGRELIPTLQAMGGATCAPYMKTPVGQFLANANAGNAQRIIGMIDTIFRTAYSYGRLAPKRVSETAANIVCTNELFGPALFGGIMETGLSMIGKQPQLKATPVNIARNGLDFTLEVRW